MSAHFDKKIDNLKDKHVNTETEFQVNFYQHIAKKGNTAAITGRM